VVMTAATNRRLTEVGPGTPMGHLLRRYWQPIAAEDQFAPGERRPVRVLGEDLVLYRTPNGEFGLIERHCPHRRADLLNGYVEDDGIRCSYHGWKFDVCGRCVSQPFEEAAGSVRLKDRVPASSGRTSGPTPRR
jgi:5,5'-dehydrodivanillate O-demethylase oxygenase subunit